MASEAVDRHNAIKLLASTGIYAGSWKVDENVGRTLGRFASHYQEEDVGPSG